MRHGDAWSSATAETIAPEQGFESLRGRKYCLLTTFRKRGAPAEGRGRILDANESERAERAIAANYGLFRKLYEGVGNRLPIELLYIEIEPASAPARASVEAG